MSRRLPWRSASPAAALLLAAACAGEVPTPPRLSDLDVEEQLAAELSAQQATNDGLRGKGASAAENAALGELEKELEHVSQFDGVKVWTAVAEPVALSFFAAAAVDTGTRVVPALGVPTAAALPFTLTVEPAGKAWLVASRLVGDTASRPTVLLDVVEPGRIEAHFALEPQPIPPDPARPPPGPALPAAATSRGKELVAKLSAARAEHEQLHVEQGRAESNRLRAAEYRRRLAAFARVGDLREQQRALAAGLATSGATRTELGPEGATLRFSTAGAARKAAALPGPKRAGLSLAVEGTTVTARFAGTPPVLAVHAERMARAAAAEGARAAAGKR